MVGTKNSIASDAGGLSFRRQYPQPLGVADQHMAMEVY